MWDIIKTGLIFTAYTIVAGVLLAVVYLKTAPIIAANKEAASNSTEVLLQVLPAMGAFEKIQGDETDLPYWVAYTDAGKTTVGGYIFKARGKGYASVIETLVGVDPEGVITGALVVAQNETPGLGDKVTQIKAGESDPWFTRQFAGRSATENLAVAKDKGDIEAISGATISSRAVTNAINAGVKQLMGIVGGEAFAGLEVVTPVAGGDEQEAPVAPTADMVKELLPAQAAKTGAVAEGTDFPYLACYAPNASAPTAYAVIALGEGFGSTIQTLVIMTPAGKILAAKVIYQDETEGYGDQVVEIRDGESDPWFTRQFTGKSPSSKIALTEDGGVIDAISGATISSRAVTESVAAAVTRLTGILSGKAPAPAPFTAASTGSGDGGSLLTQEAASSLLPGMASYVQGTSDAVTYWTGYRDAAKKTPGGHVFLASGEGFNDDIVTAVAVDASFAITAAKILAQDETEGYGTQVGEPAEGDTIPWVARQLVGKSAGANLLLSEDGGSVDAISGATISSRAVAKSVAASRAALIKAVTGKAPAAPASAPAVSSQSSASDEYLDAVRDLLPGMASYAKKDSYWAGYKNAAGTTVGGYAFLATGEGFNDDIVTLVAVGPSLAIAGITVLSQDETEGYGTMIEEPVEGDTIPWITRQFVGRSAADDLRLSEDGGVIDAVSGATVSSRAVAESIAGAMAVLKDAVK